MDTSDFTTNPRNPSSDPCPIIPADMATVQSPTVFIGVYFSPTVMVPYYSHVSPIYQSCGYFYFVAPAMIQPLPCQWVDTSAYSGGLFWKKPMTTVMIRNIPNQYSRDMLVNFLDRICHNQNTRVQFPSLGVPFEYDFIYLPIDFSNGHNLGYAFVNFTSPEVAEKFGRLLSGHKWGAFEDCYGKKCESKKICEITWADIQGKEDLVKHFKHSRFLCSNMEYLPTVFSPPCDGTTSPVHPSTVGTLCGRIYGRTRARLPCVKKGKRHCYG